ncbi:LysE family translocator [Vibrio sp. S11_S32]|uniref:LysE family translocator n=1 Tax=Vibrio sp. S11_S32 TaxID=2720225 RepID=UPI00168111EA|nr:LysE family translocator [Vibrio sp. S11_S32]MBD1575645.1 LysE family translocator [Vibrio sp. S11_S32]
MDLCIINASAFLVTITILTLTPGLDTAIVIRNTTRNGSVHGCITSLGICCGLFVHATLSAIGISAILLQSAQLFHIMKWIGAAYLVYLGITSLIGVWKGQGKLEIGNVTIKQSASIKRSFREGLLSNVLNPKTAVFYLAFLPQFINPEYSPLLQSLLMASIHFVIAMVWQCGIATMIHSAKNWVQNSSAMKWMEGVTGVVLVSLGIKLALDSQ